MESPEKHFHVYYAPGPNKRGGKPSCPSCYVTDELGYWSRTDANHAARKYKHGVIVKQCSLPGCRMKDRWIDSDRDGQI